MVDLSQAFARQEKERTAILTVSGLAHAIARAEEHMREQQRARSSQPDIFAALAATDDCAGPAVYQPYVPTPIPPPPRADDTLVMPRIPRLPAPAPILVLDRQAFYHPAGPIPGFAPRPRRSALGWAAIAIAPLVALVVIASVLVMSRPWQPNVTATLPAAAEPIELEVEAPPPAVEAPKPEPIREEPRVVVDVKQLKSATKPRAKR